MSNLITNSIAPTTTPNSPSLSFASNGAVLMPNQPRVAARRVLSGTFTPNGVIVWNTEDIDNKNCYNPATGVFTAPVAGYYFASAFFICPGTGAGGGSGYIAIRKNGSTIVFTHWNHAGVWVPGLVSSVVNCAVNDTIDFNQFSTTPANLGIFDSNHNGMCIFFIG